MPCTGEYIAIGTQVLIAILLIVSEILGVLKPNGAGSISSGAYQFARHFSRNVANSREASRNQTPTTPTVHISPRELESAVSGLNELNNTLSGLQEIEKRLEQRLESAIQIEENNQNAVNRQQTQYQGMSLFGFLKR